MNITLHVWRQKGPSSGGHFETVQATDISEDMSFLEMLDVVNARMEAEGKEPIVFEHDCREGVCGCCGFMINGLAHGGHKETTVCQLHMRSFKDGDELTLEPWRSAAFPIVRDLMVDRSAFDRIIQAGGYISVRTGSPQDANNIPVKKEYADRAFDAAACIGCGACVASCPNGAAMLFTGAKVTHLGLLPQGQVERYERVQAMTRQMDAEGFGYCTNHGECEASCPKGIKLEVIGRMNRDLFKAQFISRDD
ncbi:MAG: succinate dehydrogenase/fumarate reductase iron-sulfur subunit [Deltaproteobacteria bacterium]|nr:MAG: succinate dehydrogenase/fumarate reductase iron-sulfur subunit [Deltaproteobacteria bacterium]